MRAFHQEHATFPKTTIHHASRAERHRFSSRRKLNHCHPPRKDQHRSLNLLFQCLFLLILSASRFSTNYPLKATYQELSSTNCCPLLIHLTALFLTKVTDTKRLKKHCDPICGSHEHFPGRRLLRALALPMATFFKEDRTCVSGKLFMCRIFWQPGGGELSVPTSSDKCCIHTEVSCMLGWASWASGLLD